MTLALQLSDETQAALKPRRMRVEFRLRNMLIKCLVHDVETNPPGRRPIWEVIAEKMKSVPAEDLATLPSDGASQIDHYVWSS